MCNYTALCSAAFYGHVDIVQLLLDNGAEVDSQTGSTSRVTALMLAVMKGYAG